MATTGSHSGGESLGLWACRNRVRTDRSAVSSKSPDPTKLPATRSMPGVYVLEPSVLQYMPKDEPYSFERGLFPTLLEKKERVVSFILDKYWIDIGTPQKVPRSPSRHPRRKVLLEARSASASGSLASSSNASVDTKSIIDADVTIRSGVRIENSVIGRNCKIEEGAQIIDSVIWPGNTHRCGLTRGRGASSAKAAMSAALSRCGPGVVLGDKTVATDFSQL